MTTREKNSDALVPAKVTRRGIEIPFLALTAKAGEGWVQTFLKKRLTVVEKPQKGRPKSYSLEKRSAYTILRAERLLVVPRAQAAAVAEFVECLEQSPENFLPPPRPESPGAPPGDLWRPAQAFYGYQNAAAEYLATGPLSRTGFAYLQMGTGLGKSRLAMAVAARYRGPVFVVVPTKGLRAQWLEEFRAVFPRLACGSYENPPKNSKKAPAGPATHDVLVGIVNTVRTKDREFFRGFSTVILDEAHELHSPANKNVLWTVQAAPYVLGLSATPLESERGLDQIVCRFLGEPIYAEKDIPGFNVADVRFSGRVREVQYYGHPDYCEAVLSDAGTVCAASTIGLLVQDPFRLRLVASEVARLYNLHSSESPAVLRRLGLGPAGGAAPGAGRTRKHGIFVFAELRDYLPALRDALLEFFAECKSDAPEIDAPEIDAPEGGAPEGGAGVPVVLRGGATAEEQQASRRARIVLTTYGYSRRGVSIVDMTAIVLATPRRTGMTQILGRVTRRGSDESIVRQVVDLKDMGSPLKSQSTACNGRRSAYKQKNYPIYRARVNYADVDLEAFRVHNPGVLDEELVWAPGAA